MIRILASLVFTFAFLFSSEKGAAADWVDKSNSIFLSKNLQKKIGDYQAFPAFWWNFLVRDAETESDWAEAAVSCDALREMSSDIVSKVECQQNLKDFMPFIKDWSRDFPLRSPMPTSKFFTQKFNQALSQASLPFSDPSLLNILRVDPLETWKVLKERADSKLNLNLSRKGGFFYDQLTHRLVIPIQMAFPASETSKTAEFKKLFSGSDHWTLIGPHGSYLQNETQVMKDVAKVSLAGTLLLAFFAFLLWRLKRLSVLLLVPPVAVAMIVSTFFTVMVFGTIHGITLSFGTGIVGLALDYGLQAAFNGRSPHLWRSNSFGLATTAVGLLVLMFSSVPLIQQMMFFAIVGLFVAFFLFYLFFKKWPGLFHLKPLPFSPKTSKAKTFVISFFILASLISFFVLKPTLDMSRFDFQDEQSKILFKWIFQTSEKRPPLFEISSGVNFLDEAITKKTWADTQKIPIENLAEYVPSQSVQSLNHLSWSKAKCDQIQRTLNQSDLIFFKPYWDSDPCGDVKIYTNATYLTHLHSHGRWLSLWLPENDIQESAIRKRFPEVISLKEVVSEIPLALSRELLWITPLSVLLAACLLFYYYRNFWQTFLALVPFFSGMGLVSLCALIFDFNISFVSVIGLVMVFGFSIDYGIFATDIHRGLQGQSAEGVWTGLTLAAVTTGGGFFPLLFCKHPILLGLGQSLFLGSVGTYIGASWGIPGFTRFFLKREKT